MIKILITEVHYGIYFAEWMYRKKERELQKAKKQYEYMEFSDLDSIKSILKIRYNLVDVCLNHWCRHSEGYWTVIMNLSYVGLFRMDKWKDYPLPDGGYFDIKDAQYFVGWEDAVANFISKAPMYSGNIFCGIVVRRYRG